MLTLIVGMKRGVFDDGLGQFIGELAEVFEVFVSVNFFCATQMELKKREKSRGCLTGKKEEMANYNLSTCRFP